MNLNIKSFYVSFVMVFAFGMSKAQSDYDNLAGEIHIGLNAGATYSRIDRVNTAIMNETYFTGYTLDNKWKVRYPHVGGFIQYNIADWAFIYSEMGYADEGGYLKFHNIKDYDYSMNFNYQYINIIPMAGVYFLHRCHFAIGLQYGFKVASDKIYFNSENSKGYDPDFHTDLEQQQQLRNVLKGKNEFGFTASLGGVIWKGFGLEGRGHLGTKNVLEVLDNSFHFIPQKSTTTTVELLITYRIPLTN